MPISAQTEEHPTAICSNSGVAGRSGNSPERRVGTGSPEPAISPCLGEPSEGLGKDAIKVLFQVVDCLPHLTLASALIGYENTLVLVLAPETQRDVGTRRIRVRSCTRRVKQ